MNKHGMSHGLAVLVCYLAAGLFVELLSDYLPSINEALYYVSAAIIHLTGFNISVRAMSLIIFASFLAMIWGMAFEKIKS